MKHVIIFSILFGLMIHDAAKALSDNNDECNYISNMSQLSWSQEANDELKAAVKNSDPEAVRAAIWGGADPSKLIGTRWYEIGKLERLNILLISAVGADNLNNVRGFLAQGADPNAEGRLDEIMTPLITASYCASPAVMELLIHSGAKVNAHATYPGGSGEINENSSALIWASYRGDPKIVKLLLNEGADPNDQEAIWVIGNKRHELGPGTTPLLTNPPPLVLEELLSSGARPNVTNLNGETPLMFAAIAGDYENCLLLLEFGADRILKDKDGDTASDFATMSKHHDLACWINAWHPGSSLPTNKEKIGC